MAIIKCKMCGGDLTLTEGQSVCECEYCGTKQTVPTADSEKKLTLFARAGRLLRAGEFDKAAGVYESIVSEFPEEAEAYWGLILCRFGIEYVDDPATGKKVPTCHRSGFDSVMRDTDFEQACENADAIARRQYRQEAKQIEELRRAIIEVSGKEEPYDIFICYKETDPEGGRTLDSVLAQDVYDALTERGYRVFFSRISLEDKLGVEYEPYIFAALNSAKIMLAFGTDYEYFNAVWVKNEWSRFLKLMAKDKSRHLIPCFKGIDAYDMPEEFARLQSQDMGKVGAMQDLIRGVEKILGKKQSQAPVLSGSKSAFLERGYIYLEDRDFSKAEEYFEKALDEEPKNDEAYLGKALAAVRVVSIEELKEKQIDISQNKDFFRALKYASGVNREKYERVHVFFEQKRLIKSLCSVIDSIKKIKEDEILPEELRKVFMVRKGVLLPRNNTSEGLHIKEVLIPAGVTEIGTRAFKYCSEVRSIIIPETVIRIGYRAFQNCTNLEVVTIPEGVKIIESYAFQGDINLKEVILPNSITELHPGVFKNCTGLTAVSIPESVTIIQSEVFYGCASLASVSIPNRATKIGAEAFVNCFGLTSLEIPQSVIEIEDSAFYGCSGLTSVEIPQSVTKICFGTFNFCTGLASVTIPESVKAINNNAFYKCNNLTIRGFSNSEAERYAQRQSISFERIKSTKELLAEKIALRKAEAERKAAEERAEAEHRAAAEKLEAERRAKIEALKKEKASLEAQLPTLTGLFSGGKRKQIEGRLAEIEKELKNLT